MEPPLDDAGDLTPRLILDSIPALVAVIASTGEVEHVNRPVLDYVGGTPDGPREWKTNDSVHPDDRATTIEAFERAIATGLPYDVAHRLRRFDGVYRWFHVRGLPFKNADGQVVRWYVVLTDIEDRKRAEEAAKASEERLRKIIDTLPVTAWSTRPDGYCDYLNRRWLEYAGFSAEQATGWGWGDVIHPEDAPRLVPYWQGCLASGAPVDVEARMRRADGVYRWFLFRANPLRDDAGNIIKWYGTNIDIEDRKRADAALDKARSELAHVSRSMSLGVLTASIAHEVTQPLSGMITNAGTCVRLLTADPPNIGAAHDTARRIIRDGSRAADVIARLRTLFSRTAVATDIVNLNDAAQEVLSLVASDLQRSRVIARVELDDDAPAVEGDRVQLQQVILNLVRNAADAMSGVDDRPRQLLIRTQRDDRDHVRLTVQDVGIGIASEAADRLFDAFYTTKSDGMGIGLSVSRSIIEGHRGRLWAESNDGPGVTFAFSVPGWSYRTDRGS